MKCQIIMPNKKTIEIPYHKLEETCKLITEQYLTDTTYSQEVLLQRKEQFTQFQKQYKTFKPYFDFVILHLGCTLKNPFFVPNSILVSKKEDGINYYYVKLYGINVNPYDRIRSFEPILIQGVEVNINRTKIEDDYENLPEGFVTEDLELLSLKGKENTQYHNFWSKLWLHELMMTNESVCTDYLQKRKGDLFLFDSGGLLMEYKAWLRFCKNYICYNSRNISETQSKWIEELQQKKLLPKTCLLDMNESK